MALLLPLVSRVAAGGLFDALSSARFLHEGLVRSCDFYEALPIPCLYLEPENVTSAPGSWSATGTCPYLFAFDKPPTTSCKPMPRQTGMDLPGMDYATKALSADDAGLCEAACCGDARCLAWVYAATAPGSYMDCKTGDHCCYLKAGAPSSQPHPGLVSGTVSRDGGATPPLGMRSAVPLGGLGAGAMELRADGSFHEVTIMNGSPAGAAKFGVLGDAWLALRAAPTEGPAPAGAARMVRTHPPSYAKGAGVGQIGYSGAYPLSRLSIKDPSVGVTATAYAYSTLVPGEPKSSAYPAVYFTVTAKNPSNKPQNVSWALSMPMAAINDCKRAAKPQDTLATVQVPGYAGCLQLCSQRAGCASWTWQAGSCVLASTVPLNVYAQGAWCGVAGQWSSDGASLTLTMRPPGVKSSPAIGDVTLRPSVEGQVSASFAVADDPADLWADFAEDGVLGKAGAFGAKVGAFGAAAVSAVVPAGGEVALTVVFAWYFPDRDHMGEIIGNFYSTLWKGSGEVAAELAAPGKAEQVVSTLNAHHAVFAGPKSSVPDWIADHMINQMSHFRGLIWFRDGRMREFEANDCPDVDSIHNDYQRHLPYLWMLPEYEHQKLRKWGSGQFSDGHIPEFLGAFELGPIDVPGGRVMSDTTSIWVIELLELFRHTGNRTLLQELWPIAKRAIAWQIEVSKEVGLPWQLVSTYDILNMNIYNTTSFNGFLHLAVMRAARELATLMGDAAVHTQADDAFQRGQNALQTLLWNSTLEYFRAFTGSEALMSDTLYGQLVAHHHNLGWLMPQELLGKHLAAELKYNGNPFGLTVITGRHTPPPLGGASHAKANPIARQDGLRSEPHRLAVGRAAAGVDTTDDTVWEGGAPDWSYLAMVMDKEHSPTRGNLEAALEVAGRSLNNWRTRLADLWNIAGLTTTGDWGNDHANGMPWTTSHYGFMLTDYYLVPALSGQQTDIAAGRLTFAPLLPCPFTLPALLHGTTGTISCDAKGTYTLALAFGQLKLPAGGLAVNGAAHAGPVDIAAGQQVSWSSSQVTFV